MEILNYRRRAIFVSDYRNYRIKLSMSFLGSLAPAAFNLLKNPA